MIQFVNEPELNKQVDEISENYERVKDYLNLDFLNGPKEVFDSLQRLRNYAVTGVVNSHKIQGQ
jgi:hypothetical protein